MLGPARAEVPSRLFVADTVNVARRLEQEARDASRQARLMAAAGERRDAAELHAEAAWMYAQAATARARTATAWAIAVIVLVAVDLVVRVWG